MTNTVAVLIPAFVYHLMTDDHLPVRPSVPDQEYVYIQVPQVTFDFHVTDCHLLISDAEGVHDIRRGGGVVTLITFVTVCVCPSDDLTITVALFWPAMVYVFERVLAVPLIPSDPVQL